MNYRAIIKSVSILLLVTGVTYILPLFFSITLHAGDYQALLVSMCITLIVAGTGYGLTLSETTHIQRKDGFVIVTFAWLFISLFGALPYYFSGTVTSFTDAFFESMSGFTTTGATILTEIEDVSAGILFWRSLTHWLGGMGIIVLSLAILPIFGIGGMQLYKAEVPGPTPDRLKPRITETAKTLWIVYVAISAAETVLLLLGGMSLFDSLCHTFGTMATGGFSTRNLSIGAYDSAYIDGVITVFMFLAGVNFALHFAALKGKLVHCYRNSEFKFYVTVTIISIAMATCFLAFQTPYGFWHSFRMASFQVVSIITTTGYSTDNFELWPYFPQVILLCLMFMGGCAGSTAGSVKQVRVLMLLKHAYIEFYETIHPKAIKRVKLGQTIVSNSIIQDILAFFLLFLGIQTLGTLFMAALGLDLVSAFSSVLASLGNVGPGLGSVGPMDNYAHIPILGKWFLSFCMMVGRLELYTVLILFIPEFWKR
ncbi:TrkH family potassium uptake protein [bacterium]|nr:TrkH family potassium uptake protein [bacterium]